jgi:hypothetical protein
LPSGHRARLIARCFLAEAMEPQLFADGEARPAEKVRHLRDVAGGCGVRLGEQVVFDSGEHRRDRISVGDEKHPF